MIDDLIDWYRDWRYGRLYRQYASLSKDIELRQYARDTTKVNGENQAEAFLAFLDRRIDVAIKRRDKVAAKLGRVFGW